MMLLRGGSLEANLDLEQHKARRRLEVHIGYLSYVECEETIGALINTRFNTEKIGYYST